MNDKEMMEALIEHQGNIEDILISFFSKVKQFEQEFYSQEDKCFGLTQNLIDNLHLEAEHLKNVNDLYSFCGVLRRRLREKDRA